MKIVYALVKLNPAFTKYGENSGTVHLIIQIKLMI
jgi:hypothetical protein